MSSKQETIYLRIPTTLAKRLSAVAKLAGVSQQTVIKVALATDMLHHLERSKAGETP